MADGAATVTAAGVPHATNGGSGSSNGLDKKDQKYDRQLRLWGARGQKALMESHILLINAGPTGTELLKNLVLPGVGRFTILDEGKVGPRDVSNNFFVTHDVLGQNRGKVAAALLKELNPDVEGSHLEASPESLLAAPGALAPYSLVVATQCSEAFLGQLAGACASAGVPLLVARSYGMIGYLRLQLASGGHAIVDAKAGEENKQFYNLALAPEPLPEVQALADSMELEGMDHHALSRVPFVLLLLKAKQRWVSQLGEALPPQGTAGKRRFAEEGIKALALDPADDNFAEALKRPYLAYLPFPLPEHTQALFAAADKEAAAPAAGGGGNGAWAFWVVVRAIKGFVEHEGQGRLPLSGAVPDMASSTENYTLLQTIYRQKAAQDLQAVLQRVGDLLESSGRARDAIPVQEVEALVKNAYALQVVHTRPLAQELSQGPDPAALNEALEDGDMLEAGPDMNPILFYLGLRAVDRFYAQHNRYPGTSGGGSGKASEGEASSSLAADEEALWALLQAVAKEYGATGESMEEDGGVHAAVTQKHAREMARYGAAELHNIAAILGGIGSQEAVKVLTQQYVPLNNTFVYNGVASTGGSYQL